MWKIITNSWSLLLAMFLLMASNGMLVTLLSLRGNLAGMSTAELGFLHSAYPFGALIGCLITAKLVQQAGHIRVFAAAASLASTAALIHMVFIDVWIWSAMRLLSGFCYAGLYIVVEGWLNEQVENRYRAQFFSVYAVISSLGVAFGQYLLTAGDSAGIGLFVLISVFISISIVPVLIATESTASFSLTEKVGIIELFKQTPTALIGAFLMGIIYMLYFINMVLYLTDIGIAESSIGIIAACGTLGTLFFQFPIARLSDRFDRRKVLIAICLISIPVVGFIPLVAGNNLLLLYLGFFLLGGLVFPIYSLCVALLNDRLQPAQMVAASGTFVLVVNIGQIISPSTTSLIMEQFGSVSVFWVFAITLFVFACVCLTRQNQNSISVDDQEPALNLQAISPTIVNQIQERVD